MENLNAEQIKKALERDIRISIDLNYECPRITYSKLRDALDLITSQEQRIKELSEERKDFAIRALRAENEAAKYKDRWETSRKDFERLADENERLNADCVKGANALIEEIQKNRTIEADTVRKMQELVRKKIKKTDWLNGRAVYVEIDKTAKEVLEGKNEIKTNSEHS